MVGSNIRIYREKKGLTPEELSALADVPVGTIKRQERMVKHMSNAQLQKIAKALGCTFYDLIYE